MTLKKPKSEHKKNGRPLRVDENIVRKLEEAFEWGSTDIEACLHAGISKQTLYDHQTRNPGFADRKAALKDSPKLKARRILNKALQEDDKDTAKWYLERKAKEEFSLRQPETNVNISSDKIVIDLSEE